MILLLRRYKSKFEPKFTVDDGILEIIKTIKEGLYDNEDKSKNLYGNYFINYNIDSYDQ